MSWNKESDYGFDGWGDKGYNTGVIQDDAYADEAAAMEREEDDEPIQPSEQ